MSHLPQRTAILATVTALLLVLTGCGFVDYDNRKPGVLRGNLLVLWVGEGDNLGDGSFIFVPDPKRPLVFERSRENGTPWVVRPRAMYTDGGSIPRLAQVFQGFQPWGYAPAYMVHDWLFVAKNCRTDDKADETHNETAGMTFQDSADILAEVVQTLVQDKLVAPNDVAPQVISNVVAGPVTRALWTQEGACDGRMLSPEDRARVDAVFAPRAAALQFGPPGSPKRTLKPAQVIASFSY